MEFNKAACGICIRELLSILWFSIFDLGRVCAAVLSSKELQEPSLLSFCQILSIECRIPKWIRRVFLLEMVPVLRISTSFRSLEASHEFWFHHHLYWFVAALWQRRFFVVVIVCFVRTRKVFSALTEIVALVVLYSFSANWDNAVSAYTGPFCELGKHLTVLGFQRKENQCKFMNFYERFWRFPIDEFLCGFRMLLPLIDFCGKMRPDSFVVLCFKLERYGSLIRKPVRNQRKLKFKKRFPWNVRTWSWTSGSRADDEM